MTRPSHHHVDCNVVLNPRATDDECNCSWLILPSLRLEDRFMITSAAMGDAARIWADGYEQALRDRDQSGPRVSVYAANPYGPSIYEPG